MNAFENCCMLLPAELKKSLAEWTLAEEVRLRCGERPSVLVCGREHYISKKTINEDDIVHVVELATGASVHSSSHTISNGYINYKGIRIGLCGPAIYKDEALHGFRRYSSVSLRIPHQLRGIIPEEISCELRCKPQNLLVIAPPGGGKTTALREIVRMVSAEGMRVSLIDERGEICGAEHSFELGSCTDVISGVPKCKAAIMMLRGMNPQLIAMDEISKPQDIDAVFDIRGCGVSLIATAHGSNLADMLHRPLYQKIFDEGIFDLLLTITLHDGKREYKLERISI